jgi:diguanylate cyclase (GGDEF)-like protein
MWPSRLSDVTAPQRRLIVVGGALIFTLLIHFAETRVPIDIRLGMFYLVPVLVATWYEGPGWGGLCVAAAVVLRMALDVTQTGTPLGLAALHQGAFVAVAGIAMFGFAHMRRTQDKLERLATHDHLTGTLSADAFTARVTQELQRNRRYRQPVALLYVDLDNFKSLNDTHGHQTGDAVLRLTADALRRAVREVDVVGRLGGDEFAVLMPETDGALAAAVAHRLGDDVRHAFDGTPAVTASIGIVSFAETAATAQEILRRADQAMYEAKRAGKDRIVQVAI